MTTTDTHPRELTDAELEEIAAIIEGWVTTVQESERSAA